MITEQAKDLILNGLNRYFAANPEAERYIAVEIIEVNMKKG